VRPIAAEWPLLKVQRSVASHDDEWQVPAAAVIGLQNLTGCSQPEAAVDAPTWPLLAFSCMRENFRSPERCRTDRRSHLSVSGFDDDNI
jgi:hypothetical protein